MSRGSGDSARRRLVARRLARRRRRACSGSSTVNVAPLPLPSLCAAIVPPCSVDQRLGDRQPQPQPAEDARDGLLALLEGVEDARQRIRLDADAGVR